MQRPLKIFASKLFTQISLVWIILSLAAIAGGREKSKTPKNDSLADYVRRMSGPAGPGPAASTLGSLWVDNGRLANLVADYKASRVGDLVTINISQSLPPIFTRLLADRLASASQIPVQEATANSLLTPGHAWIAPGNYHMVVKRTGLSRVLALNQDPPENSCRPAVDVLFRSVAEAYGAESLAVVMTGMGADGVIGSHSIHQRGGQVIVQDEASSVVWGMPGGVYQSGEADGVYPLNQLSHEITRRVLRSRAPLSSVAGVDPMALEPWAR
jgi:hypothetical protein